MSDCVNCKNDCLQEITDKCIRWVGEAIPHLGIEKGMYYDQAVIKFAQSYCDFSTATYDLHDLQTNKDERSVTLPDAISIIVDRLCNLSTDNLKYTGSSCLSQRSNSISTNGAKLLNRGFDYSIVPTDCGFNLEYDMGSAINNLPEGYSLDNVQVLVNGKSVRGSSIIADSNNPCNTIPLDNDRYPINVDFKATVRTENGNVILESNEYLKAPQIGQNSVKMRVNDKTITSQEANGTEFLDMLSSTVCQNTSDLDGYRNSSIPGFEGKDIKNVVASNNINTSQNSTKLSQLDKIPYTEYQQKGCTEYKEGTVYEVLDYLNKMENDTRTMLETLQAENQELRAALANHVTNYSLVNSNRTDNLNGTAEFSNVGTGITGVLPVTDTGTINNSEQPVTENTCTAGKISRIDFNEGLIVTDCSSLNCTNVVVAFGSNSITLNNVTIINSNSISVTQSLLTEWQQKFGNLSDGTYACI